MHNPELKIDRATRIRQINLQLAALGKHGCLTDRGNEDIAIADYLRDSFHIQRKQQRSHCPADERIQNFLDDYFTRHNLTDNPVLPLDTFLLNNPGVAEELSLPIDSDKFSSRYISSYRVQQGVLHNPTNDRRTTKGVFHIVEGGTAISYEKSAVPVATFHALLTAAFNPPRNLLQLPFTSKEEEPDELWASLLLRPIVCPSVAGYCEHKSMEVRFFAPGCLVANMDFVERIFGNSGNPFKWDNDAAYDIEHWTGHSGCVILAPHLTSMTKKELGLPTYEQASERQRRDKMCWSDETELYNDGQAFKITCRDESGVIVTVIADNYFGYSKKEIKAQISYSANLYGGCEEEHSGAALAFASYNLGDQFEIDSRIDTDGHTMEDTQKVLGDRLDIHVEGYGVDLEHPDIVYIPENASLNLYDQTIKWESEQQTQQIKLLADHTYIFPSGYKIYMEKHPHSPTWRLIGTEAEGTLCHKPSTVSGGGKSEIAKSISDAVIGGSLYVGELQHDFKAIQAIFDEDYSNRFRIPREVPDTRSLLSEKRSPGSVIRLLTPSESVYTPEYNVWLESIPQHIRALVFIIKRFYRQEWGDNWREHFSVDMVNGFPGHELRYKGRKLVGSYLRIGRQSDGSWRLHKLRQDFIASQKVQMADDITASVTVPGEKLDYLGADFKNTSVKMIQNCERYLFQRPDDAIYRGLDKQAELDLSKPGNFISNFEALTSSDAIEMVENIISFCEFTQPMQDLIRTVAEQKQSAYMVSSAHPRLVDGIPSPNVRYLQLRSDLFSQRETYIAQIGARLNKRIALKGALDIPVNAVLQGRRNNSPDAEKNIPALAVFNPIHYQELPELFMDFICSVTGKSPSTTGLGSEGALTKGPFNALSPTTDLNNALVSFILCGFDGFSSAAGTVGPHHRVDHDVSLLIPEIWCRLSSSDRDPKLLIEKRYLEKLDDFEHEGKTVLASRLGYRISKGFVHAYFGKIFDNPTDVFDEAMLKPELQSIQIFVDGVNYLVEAQQRVAQRYFDDGTIELACPPLKALLHIMVNGEYQGMDINHSNIRNMFTKEYLISSDWYQKRLIIKQQRDIKLWQKHVAYAEKHLQLADNTGTQTEMKILLSNAKEGLSLVSNKKYLEDLHGTIGADSLG